MERTVHPKDIESMRYRKIDKLMEELNFKDNSDLDKLINEIKVQYTFLDDENRQLKKYLEQIENQYESIHEQAKYCILNKEGKIKFADENALSFIEFESKDLLNRMFHELIDPNFRNKFNKIINNVSEKQRIQRCIIKIADKEKFYDTEIIPLFDPENNLIEYMVKLSSITEVSETTLNRMQDKIEELIITNQEMERKIENNRISDKKLRANEKREQARSEEFARVLDAVPAAVWISHDIKGLWITGNELSYEYLNVKQGANASKFLPPIEGSKSLKLLKDGVELRKEEMPVQMSSKGNEISNYEFDIMYSNNTVRHMMGNATPLFDEDGNPRGSVSVFMDITDYKKAKIKTESLLKELERSNRELDQFAYVTSHDLKEPLRMISSFTQLLEKRYSGSLDQDADEFIGFIVDGASRMQQMLDSLLQYSRISTEAKKYELVDMNHVVNESLKNLKIAVEENDAEINVEKLPMIYADRSQMIQLFQNLIANAIKFHGDETPNIQISSWKEGDKYYFAVKDNGIGIDPKYQERIFQVFQRLHTTEEYEGTGIGLSITKKILEHHNGSIWVKSQPNKGSTFNFSLPIKRNNTIVN